MCRNFDAPLAKGLLVLIRHNLQAFLRCSRMSEEDSGMSAQLLLKSWGQNNVVIMDVRTEARQARFQKCEGKGPEALYAGIK